MPFEKPRLARRQGFQSAQSSVARAIRKSREQLVQLPRLAVVGGDQLKGFKNSQRPIRKEKQLDPSHKLATVFVEHPPFLLCDFL